MLYKATARKHGQVVQEAFISGESPELADAKMREVVAKEINVSLEPVWAYEASGRQFLVEQSADWREEIDGRY